MYEILKESLDDGRFEFRLEEWGKWVVAQSGAPRLRGSSVYASSNKLFISDDEAALIDSAVRNLKRANVEMGEAICFMYIPNYYKPTVRALSEKLRCNKTKAADILRDAVVWLHAFLFAVLNEEKKRG